MEERAGVTITAKAMHEVLANLGCHLLLLLVLRPLLLRRPTLLQQLRFCRVQGCQELLLTPLLQQSHRYRCRQARQAAWRTPTAACVLRRALRRGK